MTSRPYISPIPAEERLSYYNRVEGGPVMERVHLWPDRDGIILPCNPALCRECERERTWKEGQTHGV
jgi:hypothetical protein